MVVTAKRWGSREPALEPDFQTLSIKLATAVTVHRARAWWTECVCGLHTLTHLQLEPVCVFVQFVMMHGSPDLPHIQPLN